MTESSQSPDTPNLDDVIEPRETPHPDHRAHGKTPKHLNDEALEERTELERDEVAADERQNER